MNPPQLTIAIPVLNDYRGIWFTVSSLFMDATHADIMRRCEILVIDQNPDNDQGQKTGRYIAQKLKSRVASGQLSATRYIPDRGPRGIGVARNKLFYEAANDFVLVLDCHILLASNSLKKLMWHYEKNPDCNDLLTGPLLSDGGGFVGVYQEYRWRAEALGTWVKNDERANDLNGDPFEVPMQGLGLFSCRRDVFPGFSPAQRGFGCAESAFCQSFRDRGDRVLCHPGLRWIHNFMDGIDNKPYTVYTVDKVANYLLEFERNGLDPSGLIHHFNGRLNDAEMIELERRLNDSKYRQAKEIQREQRQPQHAG